MYNDHGLLATTVCISKPFITFRPIASKFLLWQADTFVVGPRQQFSLFGHSWVYCSASATSDGKSCVEIRVPYVRSPPIFLTPATLEKRTSAVARRCAWVWFEISVPNYKFRPQPQRSVRPFGEASLCSLRLCSALHLLQQLIFLVDELNQPLDQATLPRMHVSEKKHVL